jgi:hypothetical protein
MGRPVRLVSPNRYSLQLLLHDLPTVSPIVCALE